MCWQINVRTLTKKELVLDAESCLPLQVLFDPSLIGSESPGIHETIFRSIDAADIDLKKNLWSNVVLSGGSTMFNGLRDRLHSELAQLAPAAMQQHIKVREA